MQYLSHKLLRRAAHCQTGTAATEFALLLPILIFLFFGLLEASDAMTVNRKVAIAGNTMADLTAQSTQLTKDDLDNLLTGVITILDPADTTNLEINIVSIVEDSGNVVVHWSYDNDNSEPYTAGDTYTALQDDSVLDSSNSLIVVEISYPYISDFTSFVINSPITFQRNAIRWPRLSSRVQLCQDAALTICTT